MARNHLVAVIGTGSIGMRHLEVLRQIVGVRTVAIPWRQERIHDLKKAGYAVVERLEDAVCWGATLGIVATDTGRHVDDGLAAVENGLDVLVEKPMSTTAPEARRLWRAADAAGRKIFVGCVLRFSESLNTFRTLLGSIGPLHSVRIECQSYLPDWRPARSYKDCYSARAGEGGVLRDLIHEIDYAGWLYGWPVALQARVRNLGRLGIASEETAELMWEALEGCLVSVSLDYLSRPFRRRMSASGTLGTLEWDGIEGTVTLAFSECPAQVIRSIQTRDEMFGSQAHAFISSSEEIGDPRLATAKDGIKALAICDAARRASTSGREERVDYQ